MAALRAKAGAAWFLLALAAASVWLRWRRAQTRPALPPGEPASAPPETEGPAADAAQVDIVTVVDDLLSTAR